MSEDPRHIVDWTHLVDPPNRVEAVDNLVRYFRATGERSYRHDLPPLTTGDHKLALAFVGELGRLVADDRHLIIKYALSGGLTWDEIARALYADVDDLRERYRARIDHELGP